MQKSKRRGHTSPTLGATAAEVLSLNLLITKLVYPFVGVLLMLAEVITNPTIVTVDRPQLWITLVLGIIFAAGSWVKAAPILYVLAFLAVSFWPVTSNLVFPVLGVYIICIAWMIRGWLIPAFVTLAITQALFLNVHALTGAEIVTRLVVFALVVLIGIILRFLINRVKTSVRELEEVRDASAAIRSELARQLHDTIAKDLAQIAITAQNISIKHPSLEGDLDQLADMAQNTARRLRPVILNLDSQAKPFSLDEVIAASARMLTTRAITLSVERHNNLDAHLDRDATMLASLFVREAATNALKYASHKTIVDLIVELDPGNISLTMRNDIAPPGETVSVTGGFGLTSLQQRIEASGGNLTFFRDDNEWAIIATIPHSQGKTYE